MISKTFKSASKAANVVNPYTYYNKDKTAVDSDGDSDDGHMPTGDAKADGEGNELTSPLNKDVLRKKESALALMLRNAKNKFIQRNLVGKITINMLYGVISSGEFCTVDEHDELEELNEDELKQLGSLNFKATSAMDAIMANLSRRSKQYDSDALRGDVTLIQGVSFGISIPLIISMGFQTSITFECTVKSLVRYRMKKDRLRAFKKRLKNIPDADRMIREVEAGGFSHEMAQRAVVETGGVGEEAALRWAADHDSKYNVADDGTLVAKDQKKSTESTSK